MRRSLVAPPADLAVLLGRQHDSNKPRARTETGRDRDRVLYCSAFLRLGSVTQVASPEAGYTFHSRLTHSLKVAQVARRLSEQLKRKRRTGAAKAAVAALDPDATEACALAHDLGHPPFGHLAEEELHKLAEGFGGFQGNAQSFRILTRLAVRDVEQPGLNLTRQTLNGVLKYPWTQHHDDPDQLKKWGVYDSDRTAFEWVRQNSVGDGASLEARIMDWADDVTYAVHDLDDFYRAGLIPLELLCQEGGDEAGRFKQYVAEEEPHAVDVVEQLFAHFGITGRYEGRVDQRAHLRTLGSLLITRYINAFTVVNDGDVAWVEIDDEVRAQVDVLKRLIWFYIINRPSLAVLQAGQRRAIRELVTMFMGAVKNDSDRALLGPVYAERVDAAQTDPARCRVVIDLVAGLTEGSALEIYRRYMGTATGSVLTAPHL